MGILITGASGQLGTELKLQAGEAATGRTRLDLDVTDAAAVRRTLAEVRPKTVINCAAYNLVDRAEEEPEAAYRVNAIGPRTLARECRDAGVHLIHMSTDYVFGGDASRRGPLTEKDLPAPVSAYGVSKLAGEHFVLASSPEACVVRTCGLYSHHGGNFVRTMLRLAESRDAVSVVDVQRCTPTNCRDLAAWLLKTAAERPAGLVHATNAGETTWAEFAETVFAAAGVTTRVQRITSEAFGAAARRPPYSVLACDRLPAERRHWRAAVEEFVKEVRAGAHAAAP